MQGEIACVHCFRLLSPFARMCDVQVAAEAQDEETDLTKRLASLSSASSDDSTSAASSSARQLSVRSNLDPSLTPFANLSAIASRLNPALQTILDAVPAGAITVDALTSMSPLQADLRAVGACLNTDDCHVFLRTSGLLSRLCITFRLCATLLIDVCESAPSAVPTPSWFSALQAVSLTLAATSETPTNRAVIMSSGAAAALVRAVSVATVQSATVGTKTSPVEETSSALAGLELSYLPALLTLLEVCRELSNHCVNNTFYPCYALLGRSCSPAKTLT